VATIVKQWCLEVAQRIEHKWGTHNSISGNAQVDTNVTVLGKVVLGTILGKGQKVFICEFGKGSLMERSLADNPYLADYIDSSLWNPYRTGVSVRGRAEGTYVDLDGNAHESSGTMKGLNLEKDIGQYDEFFAPVEPMHIMQEEIEASYDDLMIRVQEAVDDYITRYFSMELKLYM
jgi:hypothetical protein